eukprot:COSAG02_NODE_3129_length_7312_cov_338.294191_6_plen_134_part_00
MQMRPTERMRSYHARGVYTGWWHEFTFTCPGISVVVRSSQPVRFPSPGSGATNSSVGALTQLPGNEGVAEGATNLRALRTTKFHRALRLPAIAASAVHPREPPRRPRRPRRPPPRHPHKHVQQLAGLSGTVCG